MKLFISPWKSSTPRALSRYLGARLVRLDDVAKARVSSIVNWGCSSLHDAKAPRILNPANCVKMAANKLFTFQALLANKVPTLEFTKDREAAIAWNKKHTVIAHVDTNGHSGTGLTKLEPDTEMGRFPYCNLYTKYFQKTRELRILCIRNGDGYDTQLLEKKRVLPDRYAEFGLDKKPDWFIRTHGNGWIFARTVEEIPAAVSLAKMASRVLGLDFGAVDLLARPTDGGWDIRVGEVNTAPGLEGSTLEFFKTGLNRLLRAA